MFFIMKKYNDLPLSVLDYVKYTEGMQKGDLILFGDKLKQMLKQESTGKDSELYPIGYEIEHLIHFIKQVNWFLGTGVEPGALRDYDEILFKEVVSRFA